MFFHFFIMFFFQILLVCNIAVWAENR